MVFKSFLPGGKRRQRLELSEERHWRRKLILACRKIQQVHLALGDNLTDVRDLRVGLDGARPEMGRLEQELKSSRELLAGLESRMEQHGNMLQKSLEREAEVRQAAQREGEDLGKARQRISDMEVELVHLRAFRKRADKATAAASAEEGQHTERIQGLEAELQKQNDEVQRRQARIEELEHEATALQAAGTPSAGGQAEQAKAQEDLGKARQRISDMEVELVHLRAFRKRAQKAMDSAQGESQGSDDRVAGLERELRAQIDQVQSRQARIEELELQAQTVQGERVQLEHTPELTEELEKARVRIEELVRQLQDQRAFNEARHHEQVRELRRQAEVRIAELESQLHLLQAAPSVPSARLEQEVAKATERGRARVAELELRLRGIEASRSELERANQEANRMQMESAARIKQLTERARALEDERARREEKHATQVGELQRSASKRVQDLEATLRSTEESRAADRQNIARERADEKAQAAERIRELESKVLEMQAGDGGTSSDETLEVLHRERIVALEAEIRQLQKEREDLARTQTTGSEELQARLRAAELARFELESRHTEEMMQLADHSRQRMSELEVLLREKEEGAAILSHRNGELEKALSATNATLESKERELQGHATRIQELELRQSGAAEGEPVPAPTQAYGAESESRARRRNAPGPNSLGTLMRLEGEGEEPARFRSPA